jgi:hypothetical protein
MVRFRARVLAVIRFRYSAAVMFRVTLVFSEA